MLNNELNDQVYVYYANIDQSNQDEYQGAEIKAQGFLYRR